MKQTALSVVQTADSTRPSDTNLSFPPPPTWGGRSRRSSKSEGGAGGGNGTLNPSDHASAGPRTPNRLPRLTLSLCLRCRENDMALLSAMRGRRKSVLMRMLMGVLAYRSLTRGNGRLAALIGARLGRAGGLGGLLAGGAGGAFLSAVLTHMMDNLHRGGTVAAHDIERALGEDRIRWLMARTGMTRK